MTRHEENYIKIRLKDACESIFSGGTPDTRKPEYWGGEYLWLSSGETRNKFIKTAEKTITKYGVDNSSTRLAKIGDVLIASAGQGKTRGQTSYVLKDTYINQSIIALRVNGKKIDSRYLFYLLSGKYDTLRNMSDANAIRGSLTCKMFEGMEIIVPEDVEIQKRVASLLFDYDSLIENNARRIELLESMAKLIYDEWFVKFKFPGHETVKMVDSGTDFGEIPEGWQVKRMSDFGDVITGKTPPTKDEENYGEDMQFIKTPDMHNNLFVINTEQKLSEKGVSTQKKKTLPTNSIIVSCIGTVGVVSINAFPCQTNQQINTVVLNKQTHREYLYFLCESLKTHLENLGSNGATMGNVNKEKFQSIKVLYPDEKILEHYSNICAPMFQQIKDLQLKNQNLAATCDLLLPKLMSGELDVSELDIKVSEVEV